MSEQGRVARPSYGCVKTLTLGGFMRPALNPFVSLTSATLFVGCAVEQGVDVDARTGRRERARERESVRICGA